MDIQNKMLDEPFRKIFNDFIKDVNIAAENDPEIEMNERRNWYKSGGKMEP